VPGEEPLRLAMQRLAEQLGQTGTSLEKLFRQQTGSSVHAYLVQARLHHAARLILEGQKIEAVGLEVGYRSKKNFYQQFVRMFGMTPGAYRAR
jgi:AraC-like DNA-binding protein